MKRTHLFIMASAVFSLCGFTSLAAQPEGSVTVEVTNIPSKTGQVLVTTDNGEYYGMAKVTGPQTEVKLGNLPDGKYTLYVYHDANGNWQLDKGNGIPTEYCATQPIEVTDNARSFSVELVDIMEKVQSKDKQ